MAPTLINRVTWLNQLPSNNENKAPHTSGQHWPYLTMFKLINNVGVNSVIDLLGTGDLIRTPQNLISQMAGLRGEGLSTGCITVLQVILLLSLFGCAGNQPTPIDGLQTACVEPRPQICTMDYTPVCAELVNGEVKTYSNGCSACADATVVSHRPAACE